VWLGYDVSFLVVKIVLVYMLNWLGVEYIDVYCLVCLDFDVSIEEIIGVIVELVEVGYVRYIGFFEVGV